MTVTQDLLATARRSRPFAWGLLAALFALYLASGFYVVKPEQRGIVKRFGHVIHENVMPGMHYRLPWPVDQVSTPNATEIRNLDLTFNSQDQKGNYGQELLTADTNLLQLRLNIQYSIAEPARFGSTLADPEGALLRLARHHALLLLADTDVDAALTTARLRIQQSLQRLIQQDADELAMGIRLAGVQLKAIEPPQKVAAAFSEVNAAREDRRRLIREAEGNRDRLLIKARGDARRRQQEAEAAALESLARARGDTARFLSVWQEYRQARQLTAQRLQLETLREVLPRTRVILDDPDSALSLPATGRDASRAIVRSPLLPIHP